jgi:hypothetical protein
MNIIEEIIKRSENNRIIEDVYSFKDDDLEVIAKTYNLWDNLSDEEKYFYKNQTGLQLEKSEKSEYIYGELTKNGVESLWKFLKTIYNPNDVLYDIGSGNGKLLLHLSLISDFSKLIGIEKNKIRHQYSLEISKTSIFKNVNFICDDVLNHSLGDANIIFMNDVVFGEDLVKKITSKLKKGTHLISFEENGLDIKNEIEVEVSWIPLPVKFKHYII